MRQHCLLGARKSSQAVLAISGSVSIISVIRIRGIKELHFITSCRSSVEVWNRRFRVSCATTACVKMVSLALPALKLWPVKGLLACQRSPGLSKVSWPVKGLLAWAKITAEYKHVHLFPCMQCRLPCFFIHEYYDASELRAYDEYDSFGESPPLPSRILRILCYCNTSLGQLTHVYMCMRIYIYIYIYI